MHFHHYTYPISIFIHGSSIEHDGYHASRAMHVHQMSDHALHVTHALHACHAPIHYHMHGNTYIKRGKENNEGIKRNLEINVSNKEVILFVKRLVSLRLSRGFKSKVWQR